MFDLPRALRERESPVRVGVIGAGQFGTKCIDGLERVPGLRTAAVADPERALLEGACDEAGIPEGERATVEDAAGANRAIADGQCALLADGDELAAADVDVLVEATGEPVAGARHAYRAILDGTAVVMATVEADATVGPDLAALAASRDVAYSMAYGDQPALIAEQVAWARTAGFDVVAAGRGVASYDANAAIELCAAANATGLPPDVGGFHAPTIAFPELPERLRPEGAGGILSEAGVVEAAVSPDGEERVPGKSIADGVFVVVTTPNDAPREFVRGKNRAGAYASDDGEHLAFFRPHHLPGHETPVSVARAALGGHTGTPGERVAEVVAVADEPLASGESIAIDYPETDAPITADLVRAEGAGGAVPFALLDGAEITERVGEGEVLGYDHVELPETFLRHLRAVGEV